ncbi:MAG: cytochrome c-type biosis protein CcmE [Actinomycetota bacterium]|nr:cytochrome c-type biosis protein CcmE [Actinomycetota bacterium]
MDHAPHRKRQAKFLIGGAVIVFVLGGLMAWAMARPGSTSYYLTTSELVQRGPTASGGEVKVSGSVIDGTIHRRGLVTNFAITDGTSHVSVETGQPLPSAFKAGANVVARGSFDGQTFHASEVLAKCPSKFQPKSQ